MSATELKGCRNRQGAGLRALGSQGVLTVATVPTNLTYPVLFGHNAGVMFSEANLPVWAKLLQKAPMEKAGWYFSPLLAAQQGVGVEPSRAHNPMFPGSILGPATPRKRWVAQPRGES